MIDFAIIVLLIINIAISILITICKSYFTEKGKNMATKEDIEEITKKIEAIKNEVSFVKQRENEYIQERKRYIISLLDIAFSYQTIISRVYIAFNTLSDKIISDLQDDIIKKSELFTHTYIMIEVFNDCVITNIDAKKMYDVLIKVHNYILSIIIPLQEKSSRRNLCLEKSEKNRDVGKYIEQINIEIKEVYDKYSNDIKEYKKNLSDGISSYAACISVLYELNFHQKVKYTSNSTKTSTSTTTVN